MKIEKPANKTFWVARNADGSVLHAGKTDSNQTTVSGQPVSDWTEDETTHVETLQQFLSALPDLPLEGEPVEERVYNYNGTAVLCRQAHIRTHRTPNEEPALFVQAPTNQPLEWSSYESHEFQALPLGTEVIDEGNTYALIDQGQGFRKPSGANGHFGWELV